MIAFDTNAIVRLLVEDNVDQAKIVQDIIIKTENRSKRIIILSEVLIETVWVLESVYQCSREEITVFLEKLVRTPLFLVSEPIAVRKAVTQYKQGGDFADLVIVNRAKQLQAKKLLSFDKKLQKKFPEYVVDTVSHEQWD